MPYIAEEKRLGLDLEIDDLHQALVNLEQDDEENNMEGNLNYAITRLLMMVYGTKEGTRYSQINDAIGVLECIKLEFYRKVASPYEDQKEFDNGSIEAFKNREALIAGAIDIEVPQEVIDDLSATLQSLGKKRGEESDE